MPSDPNDELTELHNHYHDLHPSKDPKSRGHRPTRKGSSHGLGQAIRTGTRWRAHIPASQDARCAPV